MDIVSVGLCIFLAGTFVAALITGSTGFAFGLVAAALWLSVLTPIQATALIGAYRLLLQGFAVWKLRHNVNAARLIPLIIGSAIGVPFGILLLRWAPPANLRIAVGIL